jgi:hypothetical protein
MIRHESQSTAARTSVQADVRMHVHVWARLEHNLQRDCYTIFKSKISVLRFGRTKNKKRISNFLFSGFEFQLRLLPCQDFKLPKLQVVIC